MLRDALNRATTTRMGKPEAVLDGKRAAYVLIFNPGRHDEGVYTLQGKSEQQPAYVLAFEQTDDADRFATLLQAEGFDLATPSCWDIEQLASFCSTGDFEVSLVPDGGLITPPSKNEYDHEAFAALEERSAFGDASFSEDARTSAATAQYVDERKRLERLFEQPPLDGSNSTQP